MKQSQVSTSEIEVSNVARGEFPAGFKLYVTTSGPYSEELAQRIRLAAEVEFQTWVEEKKKAL